MPSTRNKRKSERFNCYVPIEGKKGTVFASSQTVDISKDGIGFISNKVVPLNKKITIEIALAPEGESVLVIGKVTWIRQLSNINSYRIGVKFANVLSGSRSRLDKYFRS